MAVVATVASLAFAGTASATPPTPPFSQCPGYGLDSSCADLIIVNAHGGLESYVDTGQGSYDGEFDELVGVQNDSGSTITSVALHGNNIFGFFGKGLCSGNYPSPSGCPFGETGYEGPNTSFSGYKVEDEEENANEGTVNFLAGTIAPGQSAYFTLAGRPQISCQETACEPSSVSTVLSGGNQSGTVITVPDETAVSDSATLAGPNASVATGTVDYAVYRDSGCKELVAESGVSVSGASVPASEAFAPGSQYYAPGTYYWTASYSGDSHNPASQSASGSEVETISPPPTCSKAVGAGHNGAGATRQALSSKLNTSLAGKQRLTFTWNHSEHSVHLTHLNTASCVVKPGTGELRFSGQGTAAERTEKGYEISFSITAVGGSTYLTLVIEKGHVVVNEFVHRPLALSKKKPETIS